MHKVKFVANKSYFSEMFSQSMRYANNWRKFERVLGPIFLVLGIVMVIKTNGKYVTPNVLIIIGLYEIVNPLIKKPIWMRRQLKSKLANCEIDICFTEDGFESSAQHIQSSMRWEGVEKILETPKGIFIWPQKGVHMYIPKSAASEQVFEYINKYKV